MENNSVVKMTVRDFDAEIEIMVKDNGKGILPERLAVLGTMPLESESGTGVGLFNINSIVSVCQWFLHAV